MIHVEYTNIEMSPGRNNRFTEKSYDDRVEFDLLLPEIHSWLNRLIEEIETEDLWLTMSDDVIGKRIEDIKLIEQSSKEIIRRLPEVNLTPEQNTYITNQINVTVNIVKQNPSFDWKGLLIGLLSSAVINMTIDKATGAAIWNIITSTFQKFLPQ